MLANFACNYYDPRKKNVSIVGYPYFIQRFLVEGNASRNWRNSLFFTRLFNVSSQNNHHTENAKITWFNNQQQKGI